MEYRFSAEFNDYDNKRQIEMTQPATTNKDIDYFIWLLTGLKERTPEFAQYIVETAKLIVKADGYGLR